MPDEILSAEELESLLSTVDETGAGKRKREKRVIEYDFVRPNKLSGRPFPFSCFQVSPPSTDFATTVPLNPLGSLLSVPPPADEP